MKKLSIAILLFLAFTASAAHAEPFHVGEVGLPILWFANPQPPNAPAQNPISLAGVTVLMKFRRPDGTIATDTMTVEGTGSGLCPDAYTPAGYNGPCATYSTVAGDFTVPGNYTFQWFIQSGSSLKRIGDQANYSVGPSF
jgi:hypothetical protein